MAKTPSTTNDFMLPEPHEKLAAKFILDALEKKRQAAQQELKVEVPEEEPELQTEAAEATAELAAQEPEPQTEFADLGTTPDETAPAPLAEIELNKKYFRIGEAAELLGVEPYVLRYWESEFSGIRPMKSKSGHRTYSKKDVEKFVEIRQLLYVEKFSVKGAKKQIAQRRKAGAKTSPADGRHKDSLKHVIHELKGLIQLARGNPGL
ncbi:MAG: MerR family transcriptional regulator [Bdellovibrionaceae bacterium]|nr:MerR family transcriptional regulator [Bdellovibrionales bacterium]MCB9253729.1 MerR family transcriptional regulator [Pseudobdellovibrionaceae bacterium]